MDKIIKTLISLLVLLALGCSSSEEKIIGNLKVQKKAAYQIGLITIYEYSLYAKKSDYNRLRIYPDPQKEYHTTKWQGYYNDSLLPENLIDLVEYNLSANRGDDYGWGKRIQNIKNQSSHYMIAGYFRNFFDSQNENIRMYDYIYIMDTVNMKFWQMDISKQYY